MAVVSHRREEDLPLIGALRRLRDPLLLFVVPVAFALLVVVLGYLNSWPIGFDFRGTLWEPARALLDGAAIYPEPTRDSHRARQPGCLPPVFILASVPLALAAGRRPPRGCGSACSACAWSRRCGSSGCETGAATCSPITSPVTVHGLFYGNLTIVMVLLVALAWRYRERGWIAGIALGAAVAAKLFVWPLVVWLLLTRRFARPPGRSALASCSCSAHGPLIGFEGFRDYPKLLRVVQDVYAERSISVSTVAGALGALGVRRRRARGARWGSPASASPPGSFARDDGDRRAFAVLVAACVLASPIVWPNYAALLFVPIAVTWPRLAPVWFFGYVTWLIGALASNNTVVDAGPVPRGVPEQAWLWSHTQPMLWYALGFTIVVAGVGVALAGVGRGWPAFASRGTVGKVEL